MRTINSALYCLHALGLGSLLRRRPTVIQSKKSEHRMLFVREPIFFVGCLGGVNFFQQSWQDLRQLAGDMP